MGFDYAPPKYAQVVAEIKSRIERGQYPPGSLLPSEHQLVSDFGVSRPRSSRPCRRCGRTGGSIPSRAGAASSAAVPRWPVPSGPGPPRPCWSSRRRPCPGSCAGGRQARARLRDQAARPGAGDQGIPAATAARRRRRAGGAGLHVAADRTCFGYRLASPDLLDESIRHHLQARKKIRFDHAVERISARSRPARKPDCCRSCGCPGAERPRHRLRRHGPPAAGGRHRLPGDRHEIHDAYPFT